MPKSVLKQSVKKNSKPSVETSIFDQLTPKQQVFVKEYIVDFNGTRAALEAGCSKTSAKVIASHMLDNAKVCRAIAESLRPMMKEAELTAEAVLRQLHHFLFFDITPYIASDGSLNCSPKDLPESIRQSIIGIDGDEKFSKEGDLLSTKIRIRMVSKDSALKTAMQYFKLLEPDTQTNIHQDFFTVFYNQAQTNPPEQLVIEGKARVVPQELSNGHGNGKAR